MQGMVACPASQSNRAARTHRAARTVLLLWATLLGPPYEDALRSMTMGTQSFPKITEFQRCLPENSGQLGMSTIIQPKSSKLWEKSDKTYFET